ncbi:MAG: glutamate N-acetyltransferase / amino-acid N-acetyltransferase [Thermotogaceae bacterium]|jgi:glutamate N-acetyltransferase/amino-acid N-acetyltransferase|nr:glutamate N-acetyltransferase / amino-acid N-acetyltransferase [Thermotogaceae bacterium]MDN5337883.1 glutamate N-acetyltransferase / amino-acid N-acetyltransferase [Thermotogaceae bacterium]
MKYHIPKGFKFAGVHCGIKRKRKDLGIIYSLSSCNAAGVFTKNIVKAAPLIYNMKILERNPNDIRAIIVNSGIANACTGKKGLENTFEMANETALNLKVSAENVLVASTGVIGTQLPMQKIKAGIMKAIDSLEENPSNFAFSIMTTDKIPKISSTKIELGEKVINLLGIAKGSGMIHPNMATMLSFILTDANISPENLKKLLKKSVDETYNMIDVDGDTSTNDMVIILANGSSETPEILPGTELYNEFFEALNHINAELAKTIVKDGEGATKLIEAKVINAPTKEDAKKIVRTVVSSNLVKTAIYGGDANWGRIVAAAGYSGANFDYEKMALYIGNIEEAIKVFDNGTECPFDEEHAKKILSNDCISLLLDLKQGEASARAWGSDLTEKYVEINGRYRT